MKPSIQRAVFAEIGRRSFWFFLCWGFGVKEHCKRTPSDNWLFEPVHKGLCDDLQGCVEEWEVSRQAGRREPMDILVEIPRGYGKSTIGCALDIWIQLRNPNLTEVLSSYDERKSVEFLNVIKTYLEGDAAYGWFKELYGIWAPRFGEDRDWRRDNFTHMRRTNIGLRDPSFRAASVSKGMTGTRPDVFRLDDPVVKEKLVLEGNWREKAREHLSSSRFAVKSNGLRIVYLTPYSEGDVADKILKDEGVHSFLPHSMEMDKDRWTAGGGWRVFYLTARDHKGRSTLPNVYPLERLEKMERDDPDDFASQMMCDPVSGSHLPFNRGDVEQLWVERVDIPKNLSTSVHCDTSFKHENRKNRGDWNVIQVWGHEYGTGRVYFLGAKRSREWTGKEYVAHLVETLIELEKEKRWPFVITDEREMGGKGGMVEEFLKGECASRNLRYPNFLYMTRSRISKEVRIKQAVYGWKAGKVKLVRGSLEVESLIYEMTRIGVSKHDDMADAAADVFHPDVYMAEVAKLVDQVAAAADRPYDQLLWIPPGEWTGDEARSMYDETIGRRVEEDEESILGLGVRED